MWPDRNGSEDDEGFPRVVAGMLVGGGLLVLAIKGLATWMEAGHSHLDAGTMGQVFSWSLGAILLAAVGSLVRRRLKTGTWGPKDDRPVRRRWPPP